MYHLLKLKGPMVVLALIPQNDAQGAFLLGDDYFYRQRLINSYCFT